MEGPGRNTPVRLPGMSALQNAELNEAQRGGYSLPEVMPYLHEEAHKEYLSHPFFSQYLKMHKVAVGSSGAEQLLEIGDNLSLSYMPRHLDAAGWAYAEAGLFDTHKATAVERVQRVNAAEAVWQEAILHQRALESGPEQEWFQESATTLRLALNIAYAPLLKSIIVGNVTDSIRKQTLADTLAIAGHSVGIMNEAEVAGDRSKFNEHLGFLHETNALAVLLHMDDPKYIPFPSTARADTGYYHKEQTHDISIINQHWGAIKKVIPVEVKSKATLRDRLRYKALIIRGKMHLTGAGYDPRRTVAALTQVQEGTATPKQSMEVEQITGTVRNLLRLYQQGYQPADLAMNSLTRFHDAAAVEAVYPELSRKAIVGAFPRRKV